MRQILFRIPLDHPWSLGPLGEVPGFGFGVALVLWILFGALWLYARRRQLGLNPELIVPAAVWLAVAFAIIRIPDWMQRGHDNAIVSHTAAIKAASGDERAALHYDERGLAWYAKREYRKAAEDFRRAIEANSQFAPAYEHLAWLLATAPEASIRDGEEAMRLADRAVALRGESDVVARDVRAAALAEAGRYESAVAEARLAARLALNSRDLDVRERLSDIRRRLWTYTQKSPWHEAPAGKSLPIYGYGFMLFLGFLLAGWDGQRRARSVGLPPETMWDFAMWMLVAGVVGARLFYVVQYHKRVFRDTHGVGEKLFALVNLPDGGLVLLGGILMAVAVAWIFCGVRGISRPLMGDVVLPSLLLGMALGRLGCLMNGCCWGDACELPWAMQFPVGSVPDSSMVERGYTAPDDPNVLPLHPTQIYSAINNLVL